MGVFVVTARPVSTWLCSQMIDTCVTVVTTTTDAPPRGPLVVLLPRQWCEIFAAFVICNLFRGAKIASWQISGSYSSSSLESQRKCYWTTTTTTSTAQAFSNTGTVPFPFFYSYASTVSSPLFSLFSRSWAIFASCVVGSQRPWEEHCMKIYQVPGCVSTIVHCHTNLKKQQHYYVELIIILLSLFLKNSLHFCFAEQLFFLCCTTQSSW